MGFAKTHNTSIDQLLSNRPVSAWRQRNRMEYGTIYHILVNDSFSCSSPLRFESRAGGRPFDAVSLLIAHGYLLRAFVRPLSECLQTGDFTVKKECRKRTLFVTADKHDFLKVENDKFPSPSFIAAYLCHYSQKSR
jgi:hypothetical protein